MGENDPELFFFLGVLFCDGGAQLVEDGTLLGAERVDDAVGEGVLVGGAVRFPSSPEPSTALSREGHVDVSHSYLMA